MSQCFEHKWLKHNDVNVCLPEQTYPPSVPFKSCNPGEAELDHSKLIEDKENSKRIFDNFENKKPCSKMPNAKIVLEKSLTLSIFPDAPTTPKVSRKTPGDDKNDLTTQVKEIVKKYTVIEDQQSPSVMERMKKFQAIEDETEKRIEQNITCCKKTCVDCLCISTKPSLEFENGIKC